MILQRIKFFLSNKKIELAIQQGQGKPVVLLHGLGSDSEATWKYIKKILDPNEYSIYAFDLLGFGSSAKPNSANYSLEEQSRLILKAIKKQNIKEPLTLVGHSMGSLIALEIASSNKLKIKKLVLCSPPIYQNNDILSKYNKTYSLVNRYQNNAYFKVIETIVNNPKIPLKTAKFITKTIPQFSLNEENWEPFKKSLINSIFIQNSFNQLKNIKIPTIIIYGFFDILLIPTNFKLCADKNKLIRISPFRGGHSLSPSFAKTIAKEISS